MRSDGATGAPVTDGDPTRDLPCAHGGAVLQGCLRARPEDFVVEELLGYTASGDGEHDLLTIRKRDRNTHDVARAVAKLAGVPQVAVGYAGLKDRRAVTTQHFTVQLPGRASPDWSALEDESLQVLAAQRHHRKIRRGGLRGNRFVINVTDAQGDHALVGRRLRQILDRGVPNYFGGQRFGRGGRNLQQVDALFAGRGRRPKRELRGLLLSAARAQLFNQVLAARVAAASWDRALAGEVLSLAGSQRHFLHDPEDASIDERLGRLDIHPTGPLCGRASRALQPRLEVRELEDRVLREWGDWTAGLERFGLDADRRPLRLVVQDVTCDWRDDRVVLGFTLPAGAFATVVLRELIAA